MNETTELLSVRVAELYYEENKSQDEIGGRPVMFSPQRGEQ